jgi:hypothetical protein
LGKSGTFCILNEILQDTRTELLKTHKTRIVPEKPGWMGFLRIGRDYLLCSHGCDGAVSSWLVHDQCEIMAQVYTIFSVLYFLLSWSSCPFQDQTGWNSVTILHYQDWTFRF